VKLLLLYRTLQGSRASNMAKTKAAGLQTWPNQLTLLDFEM